MSNPRIIQNNGQSIYLRLVEGSGAVSALTTSGVSGPSTLVGGILNVPNYTSSSAIPTSMPLASQVGILANGSDQTAALNAVFANSLYAGIIMDYSAPAAVTISGTVDVQGKLIAFVPGSYFTGSGILNNGGNTAGMWQKCFDVSVNLTNWWVATEKFSSMWYGTVPGSPDTTYGLQKTLDTIVTNQTTIRTLEFTSGNYYVNQPLMVYVWTGSNYAQPSIRILGKTPFEQRAGDGTSIIANGYLDSFVMGFQQAKGLEISHIKFVNGFTPPTQTDYQFFTGSYSSFTDGVSRDTAYSPQSCLVCDPFCGSTPADGGYPPITSYNGTINFYRGSGTGGSTGCTFKNIYFSNSVCGYIGSPNGVTLNGELMVFDEIQVLNCKTGIVGTQAQEKMNKVGHIQCWGGTHTLFNFSGSDGYGSETPGHWVVDGVNIAGRVNRLISRNGTGYFPMTIDHVYAESIGTIGNWAGGQGDTLKDSTIDFVNFSVFPAYPTNTHFVSSGVTIKNCNLRYYDGDYSGAGEPLWFSGGIFDGCNFPKLPYGYQEIRNCTLGSAEVLSTTDINVPRSNASRYFAAGSNKIVDSANYIQGKQISLEATDTNAGAVLLLDGIANTASSVSITANVATVTPPTAGDLARAIVGNLALDMGTGNVLGVITAVGVSTYTISYVPDGVVSGSFTIGVWCQVMYFSFLGDITMGSPTIQNVVLDFGVPSDLMNAFYGGGFLKIPGFYQYRAYSQGARMLAYDSGANTITMDRNASESATGYYFSSNNGVKAINQLSDGSGSGSTIANAEILPKGSYFTDNIPNTGRRVSIVKTTGYYVNSPTAALTELTV